jgi:hypothetical protein
MLLSSLAEVLSAAIRTNGVPIEDERGEKEKMTQEI